MRLKTWSKINTQKVDTKADVVPLGIIKVGNLEANLKVLP